MVITTYEGHHNHHSPALLRGSPELMQALATAPGGSVHRASLLGTQAALRNDDPSSPPPHAGDILNPGYNHHRSSAPFSFPSMPPFLVPNLGNCNVPLARSSYSHDPLATESHNMQSLLQPAASRPMTMHLSQSQNNIGSCTYSSSMAPNQQVLADQGLLEDMLGYGVRKPQ